MHIMEGFLPLEWCIFWALLSAPVLVWGFHRLRVLFQEQPEKKLLVAVAGAFMLVLSSLKLPSIGGSSSHPTGAGVSTVLFGVGVTSILTTIVLMFQAMLLAHGGITTLGANIFSMGIAGPFFGILVYRAVMRTQARSSVAVFSAAFTADLMTYVVTSGQLALAFPGEGGAFASFQVFMAVFAFTQLPLAIVEGVVTAMFFSFLGRTRPELMDGLSLSEGRIGRKASKVLAAVTIVCLIGAVAMVNLGGLQGTDDKGGEAVQDLVPDFAPWANSLLELDDTTEIIMFIVQGLIGAVLLVYVFMRWRRRKALVEESSDVRDG